MQVAVLVPTTVLASQHLETFRQRFAAYPFTVRMLSRFVDPQHQKDTVDGLAAGSVDVVIGTHRLLSKDIHFRNLGLVVVDEEQRFGVAHKERLKQMRTEVHVLTLSATPIPRTLNLALAGVRDMSVIETPPEDRLPIQTRVAEASAGLVRDAILRELDRGGQVFFVHNRVETIEAQAEQLRQLLPHARVVVAHGQMGEGQLEKVDARVRAWRVRRPRVHDDHRVRPRHPQRQHDHHRPRRRAGSGAALPAPRPGRPVVPSGVRVPALPQARQPERHRSQAAAGDLQRVGAGCRLPDRAVRPRDPRRRQHPRRASSTATWPPSASTCTRACWPRPSRSRRRSATSESRSSHAPETVIDLPVDAYLPDDYVAEEPMKLELYRRMGKAGTEGEVATIRAELEDRFGPVPAPVERLLEVARLRIAASRAGIASLAREGHELIVRFHGDWSRSATMRAMAPTSLTDRVPGVAPGAVTYGSNQMRLRLAKDPEVAWNTTRNVIERLANRLEQQGA